MLSPILTIPTSPPSLSRTLKISTIAGNAPFTSDLQDEFAGHRDTLGFYGGLMGCNGGLMGFYGGFNGILWGLMGFYGGLMGFNMI